MTKLDRVINTVLDVESDKNKKMVLMSEALARELAGVLCHQINLTLDMDPSTLKTQGKFKSEPTKDYLAEADKYDIRIVMDTEGLQVITNTSNYKGGILNNILTTERSMVTHKTMFMLEQAFPEYDISICKLVVDGINYRVAPKATTVMKVTKWFNRIKFW